MVRFFLIFIIFIFSNSFFSQKEISPSILKIQELEVFLSKKKNLNYLNENGYYFLDIPNEKSFSNRLAGEILISDTSKLDIHQIDVEFLMNDYQYYLVNNWNTLLVLKSIEHLKKEMNSVE